jgi:hypothetical protein
VLHSMQMLVGVSLSARTMTIREHREREAIARGPSNLRQPEPSGRAMRKKRWISAVFTCLHPMVQPVTTDTVLQWTELKR